MLTENEIQVPQLTHKQVQSEILPTVQGIKELLHPSSPLVPSASTIKH